MPGKKYIKYKVGRDAKTGRFIPVKEAQRRKNTAVVETIKRKSKQNKKLCMGNLPNFPF